MASQSVQLTDARHATFYAVGGNQYIYESLACEDFEPDFVRTAHLLIILLAKARALT